MKIWRLVREKHARVCYDGGDGLVSAGRWHHAGRRACYASEHAALAVLEKLVWTDDEVVLAEVPFVLVPLTLDSETHLERLSDEALPERWDRPGHTAGTREVGTRWLEAASGRPVLSVPSVLVPKAQNLLVNPLAGAFGELEVGEPVPFQWDPRLFRRPSF